MGNSATHKRSRRAGRAVFSKNDADESELFGEDFVGFSHVGVAEVPAQQNGVRFKITHDLNGFGDPIDDGELIASFFKKEKSAVDGPAIIENDKHANALFDVVLSIAFPETRGVRRHGRRGRIGACLQCFMIEQSDTSPLHFLHKLLGIFD